MSGKLVGTEVVEGTLPHKRWCRMSESEIAMAWLKAKKEYEAIETEVAHLRAALVGIGESLIATGKIFKDQPDMAWNVDTASMSADYVRAGEQAKRYSQLLNDAVAKKEEVRKFESAS
jgi:hypothetical protein